jgi:hypothetical protein
MVGTICKVDIIICDISIWFYILFYSKFPISFLLSPKSAKIHDTHDGAYQKITQGPKHINLTLQSRIPYRFPRRG